MGLPRFMLIFFASVHVLAWGVVNLVLYASGDGTFFNLTTGVLAVAGGIYGFNALLDDGEDTR